MKLAIVSHQDIHLIREYITIELTENIMSICIILMMNIRNVGLN
jgi:hypothetical protein